MTERHRHAPCIDGSSLAHAMQTLASARSACLYDLALALLQTADARVNSVRTKPLPFHGRAPHYCVFEGQLKTRALSQAYVIPYSRRENVCNPYTKFFKRNSSSRKIVAVDATRSDSLNQSGLRQHACANVRSAWPVVKLCPAGIYACLVHHLLTARRAPSSPRCKCLGHATSDEALAYTAWMVQTDERASEELPRCFSTGICVQTIRPHLLPLYESDTEKLHKKRKGAHFVCIVNFDDIQCHRRERNSKRPRDVCEPKIGRLV